MEKAFYYNESANEYWVFPKDKFYNNVKKLLYPRWCKSDRVIIIELTNKNLINYILNTKIPCPIVTNKQKMLHL